MSAREREREREARLRDLSDESSDLSFTEAAYSLLIAIIDSTVYSVACLYLSIKLILYHYDMINISAENLLVRLLSISPQINILLSEFNIVNMTHA